MKFQLVLSPCFYILSFPNNSGLAYSICDSMLGLGYSLGPVIGSFLYKFGGFSLPFYAGGAANLVEI